MSSINILDFIVQALAKVVSELKAGATVLALCTLGDQVIEAEAKTALKSQKNIEKGVAFPTCISRNNVVGHFCAEADEKEVLEEGDLVKMYVPNIFIILYFNFTSTSKTR